jgi:hypothetical protein
MIFSKALLTTLQREVTKLHTSARCGAGPSSSAPLKAACAAARTGQRTTLTCNAGVRSR